MTADATNSDTSRQNRVNNAPQSRLKQPINCTYNYIYIYKKLLTDQNMPI